MALVIGLAAWKARRGARHAIASAKASKMVRAAGWYAFIGLPVILWVVLIVLYCGLDKH